MHWEEQNEISIGLKHMFMLFFKIHNEEPIKIMIENYKCIKTIRLRTYRDCTHNFSIVFKNGRFVFEKNYRF